MLEIKLPASQCLTECTVIHVEEKKVHRHFNVCCDDKNGDLNVCSSNFFIAKSDCTRSTEDFTVI